MPPIQVRLIEGMFTEQHLALSAVLRCVVNDAHQLARLQARASVPAEPANASTSRKTA